MFIIRKTQINQKENMILSKDNHWHHFKIYSSVFVLCIHVYVNDSYRYRYGYRYIYNVYICDPLKKSVLSRTDVVTCFCVLWGVPCDDIMNVCVCLSVTGLWFVYTTFYVTVCGTLGVFLVFSPPPLILGWGWLGGWCWNHSLGGLGSLLLENMVHLLVGPFRLVIMTLCGLMRTGLY